MSCCDQILGSVCEGFVVFDAVVGSVVVVADVVAVVGFVAAVDHVLCHPFSLSSFPSCQNGGAHVAVERLDCLCESWNPVNPVLAGPGSHLLPVACLGRLA